MADVDEARELFNGLPDVDPNDPAGESAARAAGEMHDEVDDIADDADPEGVGHGPSQTEH